MRSAMAQTLSPTAETRVRSWASPCGICGGHHGTGIDFSPSSSVFRCQYHSTVAVHTRISPEDAQ
jgi:hypothetical protein